MDRKDRLKMVVLERPCDTWSHPLTENLVGKMLGLKIKGYGRVFPRGVLAVDTSDFVSDHLLLCEELPSGELKPLFGNKSVPLKQCELYHLPFPGLSIPQEAQSTEHILAAQSVITEAKLQGTEVRYTASMTIDPGEREDKAWSTLLREIFLANYVHFYMGFSDLVLFCGGTIRFKVDQQALRFGHRNLALGGRELGPLYVPHLNNEPVMWSVLREFSDEAKESANKWRHVWESRIHIQAPRETQAAQDASVEKSAA